MLCALFETSLANFKSNAYERIHMAQPPGTSISCFMVHPCCGLVAIKVMKELISLNIFFQRNTWLWGKKKKKNLLYTMVFVWQGDIRYHGVLCFLIFNKSSLLMLKMFRIIKSFCNIFFLFLWHQHVCVHNWIKEQKEQLMWYFVNQGV